MFLINLGETLTNLFNELEREGNKLIFKDIILNTTGETDQIIE